MSANEATARIKINKLLDAAGWRFFDDVNGSANIQLEHGVKVTTACIDALGNDFEKTSNGFTDFLLLDESGFPLIVLEAKAEKTHPLSAKEQTRNYALGLDCRFIILSNGNSHYFWDLERGNPQSISAFPDPSSVKGYHKTAPDPAKLIEQQITADYVVRTQMNGYSEDASWKDESLRPRFVSDNGLRFLRDYQINAVTAVQSAVKNGSDRFLLEMATGTGKTLVAAALIKLFYSSGNARRILFLVDRIELEDQACKAFTKYLSADCKTVIYKETKNNWNQAEIVVTTVQSLLFNNKYLSHFAPTDFNLVISDEAHRSIGGNARAVFDYFIGYKLGLTATPRDYLKNFNATQPTTKDPREAERRLILDTYRTFGCESGDPTFRYSLLDGVRDHYLINPFVIDARTGVTTQLLSEDGFSAEFTDDDGETHDETFRHRQFEKRFFSESTNQLFCKTFLEDALRDPVSGEIGKSIIFCVSQNHAAKLVQILNEMADIMFPGKYQSDFAVQVTSQVKDAQQFTINFTNNNLLGRGNFNDQYLTSKARICVTVGMMTTGYDCPDILNLGLFRPIFSPTDFIQIKGRGTRKHDFREELRDDALRDSLKKPHKSVYKLFDFFGNCQYFEEDFNYDEVIKLPVPPSGGEGEGGGGGGGEGEPSGIYHYGGDDIMETMTAAEVGPEGMRIDREFFRKFEQTVRENEFVASSVENGHWDRVIDYVNKEYFDKPDQGYSLAKLRRAAEVDRRLSLREILEKVFGLIPRFKSKDELLEEEFAKFVADQQPADPVALPAIKTYFKAYVTSTAVRQIIDNMELADLATNPAFSTSDYRAVPEEYRIIVPAYIKDYVSLDDFAA